MTPTSASPSTSVDIDDVDALAGPLFAVFTPGSFDSWKKINDDDDVDGLVDPLLAVFFTPGPFDSSKTSLMMLMMLMLLILIVVLTPGPFDSWRKNERFKGSWSWLPPPEISKVHTIIVC
jgi:hypothetical protein